MTFSVRTAVTKLIFSVLLVLTPIVSISAQSDPIWIAYVATRGENDDIFVTDINRSVTYNITDTRSREWHPTWSMNGQAIAFTTNRDGNAEIYAVQANGRNPINLTNNPAADLSPDWSPVADEIVFISDRNGGYDLYLLDVATQVVTRLTEDSQPKSDPAWSPDGQAVVYWQQTTTAVELIELTVADQQQRVIRGEGQNLWAAWSPDGQQIAMYSQETGTADLYLLNPTHGTLQNLTNSPAVNEVQPAWSASGQYVIYASDETGSFNLYLLDVATMATTPFTNTTEQNLSADWQPVLAEIDFTGVAIGQSAANEVVGGINPDLQVLIGQGTRQVYAPEQVGINDHFRIRLEVAVDGVENSNPDDKPEEPLRNSGALEIYQFMGAQLGGFDLDNFDVYPEYNGYVLQIDEEDVNYWEWYLRPKGMEAAGNNMLTVELYLPAVDDEGVVTQRRLETITVPIEVVPETPPDDVTYVVDVNAEPTEGISIVYSDEHTLTIVFTAATNINDMVISVDNVEIPLLSDFEVFSQNNAEVPSITCLTYFETGEQSPLPRACRSDSVSVFTFELVRSDIFWFDLRLNEIKDVVLRWGGNVRICSAALGRCDF